MSELIERQPGTQDDRGIPIIDTTDLPARRAWLIERARPAVITGIFRGQILGALTDVDRVRQVLGATKLMLSRNYIDAHLENIRNFVQGSPAPVRLAKSPATLADYLDLIARDPETRMLVSEQPTPPDLLAQLDLSPLGIDTIESGYGDPAAVAAANIAYSLMFAANRGNASDLHTDWDGRDVVLYQLFGRKRIVLFPPEAAPRLHPIDIFSTVRLNGLNAAERQALLQYAGGVEHVLMPGEAMFMPAFWWHHVDYIDPSMSISFRSGGVQDPDALALIHLLHRDWHVQNIIAGTRDPVRGAASRAAARRLRAAYDLRYPSALGKYRAMRALAAECHRSTLPGEAACAEPIITAEDFLDAALCAFYRRPPPDAGLSGRLWLWDEAGRDAVRRIGRRLAYREGGR